MGDKAAILIVSRKTSMNIDAIPIGKNPPDDLNVIIEVPLGGEPIKYEIDKASGALFVDRFLYTPMRYPGNYGFIPHTLCGDGDPLDVLVMNSRPLVPGAVVRCRPVGILFMEDDGGQDEKILALPVHKLTAMYDKVHDIADIQDIQVERVKHFFTHYKDLEDLLVLAAIVFHEQHADRPAAYDGAGHQRPRVHHQHVERIAIAAQSVRDEAVISGVAHRRVEEAINE